MYKNGDRMNYALLILKDAAVMEEFMPEKSEASRGLDVSVLHTLIWSAPSGLIAKIWQVRKLDVYARFERSAFHG